MIAVTDRGECGNVLGNVALPSFLANNCKTPRLGAFCLGLKSFPVVSRSEKSLCYFLLDGIPAHR